MSSSPVRKPFEGRHRKLVIAFDIGTTFSGVSYALLDPGIVPKTQAVTRFPAQGKVGGDSKIPSIIYYDQTGAVQAVGAEANEEAFLERAEDEGYIKVEWFKLHLRPNSLGTDTDVPPLPKNKTIVDVLSDFMRYLLECTRTYIQDDSGVNFWDSVEDNIDFILAHPNGWEGAQQALMRQAAVQAGLVTESNSQSQIQFVTEGEASLHFCISKGIMNELDEGVIIVDAGGGTVDLSAYQASNGSFKEIAETQCLMQGAVYVTRRARSYLKEKLANSKFGSEEDVKSISEIFDKTTKMTFRNPEEPSFIRFGTMRDRDPEVGIRNGQMKIPGDVVKAFFQPSLTGIVAAVKKQRLESKDYISNVFLVGGFAASDWLFSNLQSELEVMDLSVRRPDGHVNKAVADGALSFYLDHFVSVRVSKITYGTECNVPYDPSRLDHMRRSGSVFTRLSGDKALPNAFSTILAKGIQVHEEKEFKQSYVQEKTFKSALKDYTVEILGYRGSSDNPQWVDAEPHMFTDVCTVVADISQAAQLRVRDDDARTYYSVDFSIVLLFGSPELKAQVRWKENGKERRSPATIVYDQESAYRNA